MTDRLKLGYANHWGDAPEEKPIILDFCAKRGHHTQRKSVDRITDIVWCDICQYEYEVDCGD